MSAEIQEERQKTEEKQQKIFTKVVFNKGEDKWQMCEISVRK